jgi:hypothetical protein
MSNFSKACSSISNAFHERTSTFGYAAFYRNDVNSSRGFSKSIQSGIVDGQIVISISPEYSNSYEVDMNLDSLLYVNWSLTPIDSRPVYFGNQLEGAGKG